ncbi:DUF4091 domain-containing protein [bacterium]|nr:MAG: DUF4091 domain-containing protein [bacterium]
MKKLVLLFALCLAGGGASFSQLHPGWVDSSLVPRLFPHADEEYPGDSVVDSIRWTGEKHGFHVSFATTDRHYFRREVPDLAVSGGVAESLEKSAWRGERLNAMILVWSPDTMLQVRFRIADLVSGKGKTIAKENLRLQKVQYVLSNFPYGEASVNCGESPYHGAFLMPDKLVPLNGAERFDLPGRTTRPVWLSISIPSNAQPGSYQGTIEVMSERESAVLKLNVNVQSMVLPPPHDWKFRLDLWQNPWAPARFYNVQPWSEEHKVILKNHLKMYAEAGGKYISTYVVHSPWSDASYRLEETMVESTRRKDGSWKFDYTIFDQYVQLAIKTGIDKAITIYTPIPWGNRFRYLDEVNGNYVYEVWSPDSKEFKLFWHAFLGELQRHLSAKGWLDRTYLGINENELSQTIAAIKVIKEHSPQWKITYAGDWHPELDTLLDDYSCVFGKEPSIRDIRERTARGSTSTYYVCCTPPQPNTFVSSCPAEGRWLGWYSASREYDGLLRWAYDAWPADPGRDARHVYWAAGDCFLVYPGAASSVRFEKLREGIIDFEKIATLRKKGAKSSDKTSKALLQELDDVLRSMAVTTHFEEGYFISSLRKGEEIVRKLSDHLGRQKD